MYEVTLINNGVKDIINDVSTANGASRIEGSIKQGINTIDSFTFSILPNNKGYTKLNPYKTLVEILDTKTNLKEFVGRILLPVDDMDNTGLLAQTVICESELSYLMDTNTRYGEYHNITVRDFLAVIINNHNSLIDADKQFVVGIVNVVDSNDSLYRFLDYDKTFNVIKDKLISRLGGELRVRHEDGVRYLDYLTSIGETKSTDIRLSKNLLTIEQEKDPTNVISRLIPLGAKKEDSEERLTIASVNNNIDYIDDSEAIAEFGIIGDSYKWDDVTTTTALISKGEAYIKEVNRIKKKYKIGALDLFTIDLDVDSFQVGNSYPVINPIMAIDEYLRVVERTVDINSPQNSNLTIGDKFEDIKDYQLGIIRANKNIIIVSNNLTSAIETIATTNSDLNTTVEVLSATNVVLNATNATIATLVETISIINTQLQNNITDTDNLATTTATIVDNLALTNTKLDKLKRRTILGV